MSAKKGKLLCEGEERKVFFISNFCCQSRELGGGGARGGRVHPKICMTKNQFCSVRPGKTVVDSSVTYLEKHNDYTMFVQILILFLAIYELKISFYIVILKPIPIFDFVL